VSHSFDPIGGKFNKEKKANFDKASVVINQLMRTSTQRRGKAKVIVKSSIFPVSGGQSNKGQKTVPEKQPRTSESPGQVNLYTTFGCTDFAALAVADNKSEKPVDHQL